MNPTFIARFDASRDDLQPDGEAQPFPCPVCGGSGQIRISPKRGIILCEDCGGSGYGPPPSDDPIARLVQWAHRELRENA